MVDECLKEVQPTYTYTTYTKYRSYVSVFFLTFCFPVALVLNSS